MRLYTIGHSTRILDDLVAALQSFGVQLLVDIRTVPRSRHAPQFNRDALSRHLPRRGIRYRHLAVRKMPGSGKPAELLDDTGISTVHIVRAVKALL